MEIKKISQKEALRILIRNHYRKSIPKLNKVYLGGFIDNKCIGIMSLGWGVRPVHTIKKLFPSLDTKDYFEIGRLCLEEFMPKNSESVFISHCMRYIKQNYPEIKLIFSWADGMLGKAGYVYQCTNFLYGGYIWTDAYFTDGGECIHPRTSNKVGGRLGVQAMEDVTHYFGKQFRYVYFLCNHKERKRLIAESQFKWIIDYPKEKDVQFKKKVDGRIVFCDKPFYNQKTNNFSDNAKKNVNWVKDNPPLNNFLAKQLAEEVSREKHQLSKLKGLVQFQYSAFNGKKKVQGFCSTRRIIGIKRKPCEASQTVLSDSFV